MTTGGFGACYLQGEHRIAECCVLMIAEEASRIGDAPNGTVAYASPRLQHENRPYSVARESAFIQNIVDKSKDNSVIEADVVLVHRRHPLSHRTLERRPLCVFPL